MTCRAHAIPDHAILFKATAQHVRIEDLWADCLLSASSGYHAEFHEVAIRRIPISDAGGQCETKHRLSWTRKRVVAAHYKKDDLYTVGLEVGCFRLPCGHAQRTRHCRSRAGARHGMCELAHCMTEERHGRGMDTTCYVLIGLYSLFEGLLSRPRPLSLQFNIIFDVLLLLVLVTWWQI